MMKEFCKIVLLIAFVTNSLCGFCGLRQDFTWPSCQTDCIECNDNSNCQNGYECVGDAWCILNQEKAQCSCAKKYDNCKQCNEDYSQYGYGCISCIQNYGVAEGEPKFCFKCEQHCLNCHLSSGGNYACLECEEGYTSWWDNGKTTCCKEGNLNIDKKSSTISCIDGEVAVNFLQQ